MEAESNIDSLVHQACDERARLLRAMQCSGAMFDTNMQCVSYIMSLKNEKSKQKNDACKKIEVLSSRIEGLLSIVESQQRTIARHTQALTLKGMWASILAPHSATLTGHEQTSKAGSVVDVFQNCPQDLENSAIALCLLSMQCASLMHRSSVTAKGSRESTAGKSVKQIGQRGPESPCSVSDVYMDEQNRGDRGSERGRDGEGGDILQQLLSKVCLLELSHSEIRDRDRENTLLRGALQLKSAQVHDLQSALNAERVNCIKHIRESERIQSLQLDVRAHQYEPLGMALEDSLSKQIELKMTSRQREKRILDLQTELENHRSAAVENKERFARLQEQNSKSISLNQGWKEECTLLTSRNRALLEIIEDMKLKQTELELQCRENEKKNIDFPPCSPPSKFAQHSEAQCFTTPPPSSSRHSSRNIRGDVLSVSKLQYENESTSSPDSIAHNGLNCIRRVDTRGAREIAKVSPYSPVGTVMLPVSVSASATTLGEATESKEGRSVVTKSKGVVAPNPLYSGGRNRDFERDTDRITNTHTGVRLGRDWDEDSLKEIELVAAVGSVISESPTHRSYSSLHAKALAIITPSPIRFASSPYSETPTAANKSHTTDQPDLHIERQKILSYYIERLDEVSESEYKNDQKARYSNEKPSGNTGRNDLDVKRAKSRGMEIESLDLREPSDSLNAIGDNRYSGRDKSVYRGSSEKKRWE